mgnify:CR=1 FL=1
MNTTTRFDREGLTYDDVLLVPAYSEVLPREEDINIQTKLTREITLNCPIASAAMDTVTESKLAIAIAQEGGIRSEEHTSELQSRRNLVCRLLLEKKKKNNINIQMHNI